MKFDFESLCHNFVNESQRSHTPVSHRCDKIHFQPTWQSRTCHASIPGLSSSSGAVCHELRRSTFGPQTTKFQLNHSQQISNQTNSIKSTVYRSWFLHWTSKLTSQALVSGPSTRSYSNLARSSCFWRYASRGSSRKHFTQHNLLWHRTSSTPVWSRHSVRFISLEELLALLLVVKERFTPSMLRWLVSPESLRQQLYWTLERRVSEFNRRFMPQKISLKALRKLYKSHLIVLRSLKVDIALNDN